MPNLNFARRIKQKIVQLLEPPKVDARDVAREQWNEFSEELDKEFSFDEAISHYSDATDLYRYMHHYFHHRTPKLLREHRHYFSLKKRGFGEDAMHTMWWLLFLQHRPVNCLEIGVYRGQVISVWTLLSKTLGYIANIHGVTPLSSDGDIVSGGYLETIDYEKDIQENFAAFNLGKPQLCKAYSTDDNAIERIQSQKWDLIYIDGSHDYDIVMKDYELCKANLAPNGILIFDDAAADLPYSPPPFAFAGHPDPSKIVVETVQKEMTMLGNVGHNVIFKH